jgi:uncharacterized protein (DUF433 family)
MRKKKTIQSLRPAKAVSSVSKKKLVREMVGGEPYEYYRLGRYIVSAPGICGGRPTFKYTRIDVRHAIGLLSAGRSIETVAKGYDVPMEAIQEALRLASRALHRQEKSYAKAA